MENLLYPTDKQFPIIYKFWQDASNETNSRRTAYELFDNHHPGIDIGLPENNKVYCSYPGIVVRREWHMGMGNVLGIRNGNVLVLYAHLNKFLVKLGEIVDSKKLIALSGNTGAATISNLPHLHFEIRDITKPTLKEMVFEPIFDEPINNLKEDFIYKVNNENTNKTLRFLATRYFGQEHYWEKILRSNSNLNKDLDNIIADSTNVLIPNYK